MHEVSYNVQASDAQGDTTGAPFPRSSGQTSSLPIQQICRPAGKFCIHAARILSRKFAPVKAATFLGHWSPVSASSNNDISDCNNIITNKLTTSRR